MLIQAQETRPLAKEDNNLERLHTKPGHKARTVKGFGWSERRMNELYLLAKGDDNGPFLYGVSEHPPPPPQKKSYLSELKANVLPNKNSEYKFILPIYCGML